MKRLLIFAFSILLILCFAACKENTDTNETTTTLTTEVSVDTPQPDTAETTTMSFQIIYDDDTFPDEGRVEVPEFDPLEGMD